MYQTTMSDEMYVFYGACIGTAGLRTPVGQEKTLDVTVLI